MVVVAGAAIRDNQVMVAKRGAHKSGAGLWEFPGGKVEPSEKRTDALIREFLEEFGVTVSIGRFVGMFRDGDIELHVWLISLESEIVHMSDHSEIRWVAPFELLELDLSKPDIPAAKVIIDMEIGME